MPLIIYTDHQRNIYEADVSVGTSIMQGALDHGIDGILGECGGNQSCATCHCYVNDLWIDKTGVAEGREFEMIAATTHPQPNSRLSCQIIVDETMEGLTVSLPVSQY